MKGKTNSKTFENYKLIQNIPKNYTRLEFIQSDGNQYIDTNLIAHSNMCCELDFEFVELPSDGCILGAREGGNRIYFYHYYQKHLLGYGGYFGGGEVEIGTRYNVKTFLNVGEQKLIVNDELLYEGSNNNYINLHKNLFLFDLNYGSISNKYKTKIKLYECKIYEENILVRYFIPVKTENNELGLYDLIEGVFYKNLGDSDFI